MKKIALFLTICFLVIGLNGEVFAATAYDYTVLIYLNGSDLESNDYAATSDILEMISGSIPSNIAVIVQTGGTKDWHTDEYSLPAISATSIERYKVTDTTIEKIGSYGNLNMGEASTLSDFVNFGITNYPANKYALFFWNHGSGPVYGYGVDENFNYDGLTIKEMDTALGASYKLTGTKFEIVGYDACLMGCLEVAEMLDDYANYLIASEELEPGHGWDYSTLMNAIATNPKIDGEKLGQAIVEGFKKQSQVNYTADAITLSVIDLSKISNLVSSVEKLFTKVEQGLIDETLTNTLLKMRLASESYGEGDAVTPGSDMVDLKDYAEHLKPIYDKDAQNVINGVQNAVVYNINSHLKPKAAGLSIYVPATDVSSLDYAVTTYKNMGFSDLYTSFVEQVANTLRSGNAEIDNGSSQAEQSSIDLSYMSGDDYNYFLYLRPEDLSIIDQVYTVMGSVDSAGDITYLQKDLLGNLSINPDGTISGNLLDYGVTLNGYFVPLYFDGYDSSGQLYYFIPIVLNGEDYDLLVRFSDEEPLGKIVGARPFLNNEVTYYDRDLVQIKPGDVITTTYEYDYWNGESYEYAQWYTYDTFTVIDELELTWDILPTGEYAYSFEIVDIYQNYYYSGWLIYDYNDTVDYGTSWEDQIWDAMDYQSYDVTNFEANPYDWYEWIADYNDVPSNWALDYVDWAYYYGLTTDATLTGFTKNITRLEFCELVVNMYELCTGSEIILTDNQGFVDTTNEDVLKAAQLGIVKGFQDNTFRPNSPINREQLIAMFYRTLLLLEPSYADYNSSELSFLDVNLVSSWAYDAAEFMVDNYLISGVGSNLLSPQAPATKEQALKLVTGVYEFYLN